MSLKRPISPNDLFRFTPVSDPQLSPDGQSALYVVTTFDLEINKKRTALWLVPTGGGAPRRLTNPTKGSDHSPRWSPCGKKIAFLSDRNEKPQLWVIDPQGGEARCVETAQRVGSAPVWSPNGSSIAFTASIFAKGEDWAPYPGAPEGDRQRAAEVAAHQPGDEKKNGKEPNGIKVITRLKFRMDGVGYYGDKRSHLFVVPADGSGPARQVSTGDYDHTSPAWTPSGAALYCAALRREDADQLNRSDIYRVDVASGEVTLVYENPGPVYDIQVAPDGGHLAFGGHENQHEGSTSSHLMLLPLTRDGAQALSLTASLDRPLGAWAPSDLRSMSMAAGQWAADSQGVYCLVGDRGESNLWYAPAGGGAPTQVTRGEGRTIYAFSLAQRGQILLQAGTSNAPDELYLLAGGEERRLTEQNPITQEFDLVQPERFTYEGADGWPMDGWLIKPVGYEPGKRYPTVLSIHGGPHGGYGTGLQVFFQTLASAGFAVLYVNPRGSQTYGQAFAKAVVEDWGGADYQDIMKGVDAVVAMGIADPDRLGVMGWSYGGYMTSWVVTQTDRFKAAITGAPVANRHNFVGTTDIPWFMAWHGGGNPWKEEGARKLLERSAITYADRVVTPTMVVCGEGDLRCPIEQAEQFYLALKRIGKAPAVHVRYPGEYHGFVKPLHIQDRYERAIAWFSHYLR
jgi:dipeptidyl aminopeptidase/acylaminoacyl peptidase